MLKGKQRAYLRSLANTLKPTTQIGKEGVTESFLEQLDGMLRTRELELNLCRLLVLNLLFTRGILKSLKYFFQDMNRRKQRLKIIMLQKRVNQLKELLDNSLYPFREIS